VAQHQRSSVQKNSHDPHRQSTPSHLQGKNHDDSAVVGSDIYSRVGSQSVHNQLRSLSTADVLKLQRSIGNHALTKMMKQTSNPRGSQSAAALIQRKNGAVPQNFTVAGTAVDNAQVKISTDKTWTSSTILADLDDIEMREVVTFRSDPVVDMPGYPLVVPTIPNMTLVANTLTKVAGAMNSGGGTDNHNGAGFAPSFSVMGHDNLRRGAWTLIGDQVYEYRDRGAAGPWTALHAGDFVITRTMAIDPVTHEYQLMFNKTGPFGVNATAGPTPIQMTTTEAMSDVAATRPDQASIWTGIDTAITVTQEHDYNTIRTANKTITGVMPNVTVPVNFIVTQPRVPQVLPLNQAFAVGTTLAVGEYTPVFANVESSLDEIITKYMGNMTVAPSRIDIILTKCSGNVRQQGIYTAAAGGVFRIVLRNEKFTDINPADKDTTMAGAASKKGFKKATKLKNWEQATIFHEMGHLLHAFSKRDKFQSATIDLMTANALYLTNPGIEAQLFHLARINDQIMNALRAKPYAQKWTYAKDNPAEVVAEIWTALMKGIKVPKGLAAVYLAYGGMRNATIDKTLRRLFPNKLIPTFNQPEDAIPHI